MIFDEFLNDFSSNVTVPSMHVNDLFINFSTFYLSVVNAKSSVLVVRCGFRAIEVNKNNKRDIGGVEDRVGGRVCVTIHSSTAEPSKMVVRN